MRQLVAVVLAAAVSSPGWAASPPTAAKGDKAVSQIEQQVRSAKVDKKNPNWKQKLTKPTAATFDPAHTYTAVMDTNKGPIRIKLLPDVAPMHVTSFIYLTKLGFYDGISFHRVIPGFMAQGGCPRGNGTGNPGYEYAGEFPKDAAGALKVKHDRPGMLSMANRGPNTDGSQFFITFVPTPHLDGKHTIFGEVVDGMETLKALETAGTQGGAPKEPLRIEKVTIEVS